MNDQQLRDLLESAADPVGEVDLVESAWRRGRSARTRQRLTWIGVGGALVAAAVLTGTQDWSGEIAPATNGPDDAASTSTSGSVNASPPTSGEAVSMTFTKDAGAQEGAALASATDPGLVRGGTWRLSHLSSSQDGELFGALGAELRFDGATWSMTACGVESRAEGVLDLGRIRIIGTWQSKEAESSAGCSPDALSAQQWQNLLSSGPEVGVNDSTLVLHAWGGPDRKHQDTDVAIAFAPRGVEPVLGPPTALPNAGLLEQEWQEVPAQEAAELFLLPGTQWLDIAPEQTVTMSLESGSLSVTTCQTWSIEHTWVNDFESVNNGVAGLLVAAGDVTLSEPRCPGAAGEERQALAKILRTHPQVYLFGDYLVIQGWAPNALIGQGTTDSSPSTDSH